MKNKIEHYKIGDTIEFKRNGYLQKANVINIDDNYVYLNIFAALDQTLTWRYMGVHYESRVLLEEIEEVKVEKKSY